MTGKTQLCYGVAFSMMKLRVPEKVASLAMMRKGFLDLATVLPADDVRSINGRGWLFIADDINW